MVNCRERAVRTAHAKAALFEHGKSLRACDLMDEMQADIERGGMLARFWDNDVSVPDFIKECFRN